MLQVTTICASVARRGSSPNPNPSLPLSQMYHQTRLFVAAALAITLTTCWFKNVHWRRILPNMFFSKIFGCGHVLPTLVARQGRAGAFFVPIGVEANHAGLRKFRHMMNESLVLAFMFSTRLFIFIHEPTNHFASLARLPHIGRSESEWPTQAGIVQHIHNFCGFFLRFPLLVPPLLPIHSAYTLPIFPIVQNVRLWFCMPSGRP